MVINAKECGSNKFLFLNSFSVKDENVKSIYATIHI